MKTIAALILCASILASGCMNLGHPHPYPPSGGDEEKEPVDINRNSVPDNLERKAIPTAPIIDKS